MLKKHLTSHYLLLISKDKIKNTWVLSKPKKDSEVLSRSSISSSLNLAIQQKGKSGIIKIGKGG